MVVADRRNGGDFQAWSRAFNNSGKHLHPHEATLQSRSGGSRLGSGLTADLGGTTSTCNDNRRLSIPLCVADGSLLPRCLDLGLVGSDLG
jgi:hypothetical protein